MKIHVLKDADLPSHRLTKGAIFEVVDERLANQWISDGIVELYKEPEKAVDRQPRELRVKGAQR